MDGGSSPECTQVTPCHLGGRTALGPSGPALPACCVGGQGGSSGQSPGGRGGGSLGLALGAGRVDLHLVLLEAQPGRQGLPFLVGGVTVALKECLQPLPLFCAVHRPLPPLSPPPGLRGQRGAWPKENQRQRSSKLSPHPRQTPWSLPGPGPWEEVRVPGPRAGGGSVEKSVASGSDAPTPPFSCPGP